MCPGSRVLCIPAQRSACSLCRETALYGNLILKKGVLAPEDLCQACRRPPAQRGIYTPEPAKATSRHVHPVARGASLALPSNTQSAPCQGPAWASADQGQDCPVYDKVQK